MHIDFHHAVTYVVARFAGFEHPDAQIVAHSSQYVDDAINGGTIYFDNGALYNRVASAHKMLDYRNFRELANHRVWIPFHFLPGNGLKPAGEDPPGTSTSFIHKIVCRPDSPIARDMVRAAIVDKDKPYGLHRLGVTMHVYADTWAHQDFAGVNHKANLITELDDGGTETQGILDWLGDFFGDNLFDRRSGKLIGDALPLGHGAALTYPDRPYLEWSFKDYTGKTVERNNPKDFLAATDALCRAMKRFIAGDPDANVSGLTEAQSAEIDRRFRGIKDPDQEVRHQEWLRAIRAGELGFPSVELTFQAKGKGSWKHEALETQAEKEAGEERYPYSADFLQSNWKLFHDGILAHRFAVVHDILPRYGICAA